MELRTRWLVLLALTVLQYGCFLLFAKGFFPPKILLPGINTNESVQTVAGSQMLESLYKEQEEKFDKLIFVVIDALRSDFVFSSNSSMTKLHRLMNKNAAIGFTGFSNPPTVTLPRLKALTTGSISSFLDAILNINENDSSSNLSNQDSWLKQFALANNSSINFFGDDTWLKIFPDMFTEYEGTSSFFVSDFTEVDNNVTRHIEPQLSKDSVWDALILHYLGLDHIGHKNGPNSVFMPAKQTELDLIIANIYDNYMVPKYVDKNQKTLMVVLGDHGMNEIGNHGGSSISENSAALVFLSPVFENRSGLLQNDEKVPINVNQDYQYLQSVNQMDMIPTLCQFFHLPIPKNNLGVLLRKFLPNNGLVPYKLLENAYQFKVLLEVKFREPLSNLYDPSRDYSDDTQYDKLDSLWHNSVLKYEADQMSNTDLVDALYEFLQETQSFLQNSSTNYNLSLLHQAMIGLLVVTLVALYCLIDILRRNQLFVGGAFFISFTLIMGASTFGSSMVEEEHQLWWFACLVYSVYLAISLTKQYKVSSVVTFFFANLLLFRLIRFWNNSGQKFNFSDEFNFMKLSYYLSSTQYQNIALFILSFVTLLHSQLITNGGINLIHPSIAFVAPFTLSMLILSFKINFEHANTGGHNFNGFFQTVVSKTSGMLIKKNEDDVEAVKNMLILLAQTAFKVIAGAIISRIVLLKVKYLWLNRSIDENKIQYVKDTESQDNSIKHQLAGKKPAGKKLVKMKKVEKTCKTFINGNYRFLSDISNLVTMLLIMQTKLENIGLYLVFFLIRELTLKSINFVVKNEMDKVIQGFNQPDTSENTESSVNEKLFVELRAKAQLITDQKLHLKLAFYITIQTLILQNLSFFQFAFTNSLSTVDLANAYNGNRSYNLVLIGVLTFVSNFAGTIYWSVNSLIWLYDNILVNNGKGVFYFSSKVKWDMFYIRYLVSFTFYTLFGLFLCIACYSLRYHLFIWTVFSPKLLFFAAWNFLVNGVVELIIALLLFVYN